MRRSQESQTCHRKTLDLIHVVNILNITEINPNATELVASPTHAGRPDGNMEYHFVRRQRR